MLKLRKERKNITDLKLTNVVSELLIHRLHLPKRSCEMYLTRYESWDSLFRYFRQYTTWL